MTRELGLLARLKYGKPVVVVSGLPRSGTSMMMKMLDAGGLEIVQDGVRTADDDNPRGYYEYERVKDLHREKDKSWVRIARGKVLKVISHLLPHLPSDNVYRVLFMRRDLDEVIASQNKMLVNRGVSKPDEDASARGSFDDHLRFILQLPKLRSNFFLLEVEYTKVLSAPRDGAAEIDAFVGGGLDVGKMAEVVDRQLYRNRKDRLAPEPTQS